VTLELGGQSTIAYAATATSEGIVVAGQAFPNGNGTGQVLVAKYDSSGKLDANFGTQGIYRSSLPEADGPFVAAVVARDAQGRLLVAGGYGLVPVRDDAQPSGLATVTGDGSTAAGDAFLTTRLTATGVPDPSFGTAGTAASSSRARAVARTRPAARRPGRASSRSAPGQASRSSSGTGRPTRTSPPAT
jgi:hypothetical protein